MGLYQPCETPRVSGTAAGPHRAQPGGSARPLCCRQCKMSSGETMPCSCLLQAQATGQPARSHWHVPPGPSLATVATPCVLGAPQMSQPHTAPVPATGRTREALLGGCWLPAGDLQMVEENGAFARYIRMVQHSHAAAGEQPLGQSGMCTCPRVPLLPAQRALGRAQLLPHTRMVSRSLWESSSHRSAPWLSSHPGLPAASPAAPGYWSCHPCRREWKAGTSTHHGSRGGQGAVCCHGWPP